MKHAGLQARELLAIYISFIRPVLEYANPVWFSSLPAYLLKDIEAAQKRALRTAFGPQPYDALLRISGLPTLHERLRTLNHNFYTGMRSPNHRLHGLLPSTREQHYNLRSARNLPLVACRTEHFKHSFIPWAVREFDWLTVKIVIIIIMSAWLCAACCFKLFTSSHCSISAP